MRVLMLGWEFPPHISGGLGVACRGLSRAVAGAGDELTFVVPRAFGDEAADWMEFCGIEAGAFQGPTEHQVHSAYDRPDHAALAPEQRAVLEQLEGWRSGELPRGVTGWRGFAERLAIAARWRPELDRAAPLEGGYGPRLLVEVARFAAHVGALARDRSVDVVHAHDWMTFPAGLVAARLCGVPLVVHVHSTEHDRSGESPDPRVLDIERMGLAAADAVVSVSHLAADRVSARFHVPRERIHVVHNSVERPRVTRDRSKVRVGRPPTVLFLGRVTRQKGPAHLLDAARRVVAERPDVRFVIAGDGDLLPETVASGAADGLAEHVLYTGFLGPDGVRRMLARADLFVLPSVSEPFGIAPLEAADAGVPVVLSNQCGVVEVLTSALRFDSWDTAELARQILRGLASEALRAELIDGAYDDLERSTWAACGRELHAAWESVVR